MKLRFVIMLLFLACFSQAQKGTEPEKLPVFKRVTHPFMPPITSEYFFFSEDGLLWFSTAQGLTSFDGSELNYYSSLAQSNQYGLSRLNAMAEDDNHNFYLSTLTGLYFYNRKVKSYTSLLYSFSDNNNTSDIYFSDLHIDKNGILYAGSVSNGLFIYDPYSKKMNHVNLDVTKPDSWQDRKLNTVSSLTAHPSDSTKIWVGTFHGIYLFDKRGKKFSQRFELVNIGKHKYANPAALADTKFIDVQRMDVANDSIIWFNSWAGGFAKYNTLTGKATVVFGRDALYKSKDIYYGYIIPRFVKFSEGKYLLGVYNGKTVIYDARTGKADYFNITKNNYTEEETRYVANDRQGNTWLLQRGFLFVSVPKKLRLQTVNVPNLTTVGFSNPKIRGIYFDSATHLFYAGFLSSSGVHIYDTNFVLQMVVPTSIINNYYNYGSSVDAKIAKDGRGRMWSTGWKVHVLLPGSKKFELAENAFTTLNWISKKGEFSDVAATRNGNIFLKQNGATIYHIDQSTMITDTFLCPKIYAEGVEIKEASAWYDGKRNLVYLTRREGIAQYDLIKRKMRVVPHNSLFGNLPPNQGPCAPTLDTAGRIWLMIPKFGIRVINPSSLKCVDSIQFGNKGLMRGDFTAIIGGPDHYILLRSQNGIVIYDYAKKQSFLFDHSNGLSSPDNKSFLYSDGYLFIGHSGRFEYFKLSDLDDYSSTVAPYLNSIVADTATIYTGAGLVNEKEIKIQHSQNTIALSFSAPEFYFPERIEYAYQLLPFDNHYHFTNYFNRKIIYSKLSPGKYVFRLKAQKEGGNLNGQPVEYEIEVIPAYWQTNWFKFLCIAIACGFIFLTVRWRITSIRKQEKRKIKHEKELLELEAKALRAQMNPHFIFNSLNSIKALINKNENEKAVSYLTIFSKLIRTLFQNSDKREVSLYEEIETCKLYTQIEKMRFGEKIKFVFDVDEKIDLKDIKVPALILQPFIENAIWHGLVPKETGGRVNIIIRKRNGTVACIIDDDGIGRETSRKYKAQYEATYESKGIGLIRSRLELDKLLNNREDKITIIDKKDKEGATEGTKVIITIKEKEI